MSEKLWLDLYSTKKDSTKATLKAYEPFTKPVALENEENVDDILNQLENEKLENTLKSFTHLNENQKNIIRNTEKILSKIGFEFTEHDGKSGFHFKDEWGKRVSMRSWIGVINEKTNQNDIISMILDEVESSNHYDLKDVIRERINSKILLWNIKLPLQSFDHNQFDKVRFIDSPKEKLGLLLPYIKAYNLISNEEYNNLKSILSFTISKAWVMITKKFSIWELFDGTKLVIPQKYIEPNDDNINKIIIDFTTWKIEIIKK